MRKFSDFTSTQPRLAVSRRLYEAAGNDSGYYVPDMMTPNMDKMLTALISLLKKRTGRDFQIGPTVVIVDDKKCFTLETGSGETVVIPIEMEGSGYRVVYYYKNMYTSSSIADYKASSENEGIVSVIEGLCDAILGVVKESLDYEGSGQQKNIPMRYFKWAMEIPDNEFSNLMRSVFGVNDIAEFNKLGGAYANIWKSIHSDIMSSKSINAWNRINNNYSNMFPDDYAGFLAPDGVGILSSSVSSVVGKTLNEPDKLKKYVIVLLAVCAMRLAHKDMSDVESPSGVTIESNVKARVLMDTVTDYYNRVGVDTNTLKADTTAYDESMKQYQDALDDMVKFLSSPTKVKNRMIVDGIRRMAIVLGRAGVGKSEAYKKLKKRLAGEGSNLRINVLSTLGHGGSSFYRKLYENRNGLLILDDATNPFVESNIGIMKLAFDTASIAGAVTKPTMDKSDTATASNTEIAKATYYDTHAGDKTLNRWDLYIFARGNYKTPATKKFLSSPNKNPKTGDASYNRALNMWKDTVKAATGATHRMPSEFEYGGCLVYITNHDIEKLKEDAGTTEHWHAIQQRSQIIILYPATCPLWESMKRKILGEFRNFVAKYSPAITPNTIYANGSSYDKMNWGSNVENNAIAAGIVFMAIDYLITQCSTSNREKLSLGFRTIMDATAAVNKGLWQHRLAGKLGAEGVKLDWKSFNEELGYDPSARTLTPEGLEIVKGYIESLDKTVV